MLLIITGSPDGTADRIVDRYGSGVFRLNYDLWPEYDIFFDQYGWKISNPSGHSITSSDVSCCYWWKAFSYWRNEDDLYIKSEVKSILKDIYGWCLVKGLVKGNTIDYHNIYGKTTIAYLAKKYFKIPKTIVSINGSGIKGLADGFVAKSLSSSLTNDKKVLHTTEVDCRSLDLNYPWFIQETIYSQWDITIFQVGHDLFGFKRDRRDLDGVDWRVHQDFEYKTQEWFPYFIKDGDKAGILKLSVDIKAEIGRYDFLLSENGDLIFLEFNAGGQWVFLDVHDNYGILDAVVNWLRGN